MTTENELRQALATEAESMKWSLSMHDVVTAEVVDNVVALDDVHRRRTPMALGAAAAVVALIGGGSYLATHRSSSEGRVLAGGRAASKVAASSAAASSGVPQVSAEAGILVRGSVSGGYVSLAEMTLVLPKDLPKTYRLQSGWAMPVGSNNGAPLGIGTHMLILKGATAADILTVNASKGGGTVGVTDPGSGQVQKIHGMDAQLVMSEPVKYLNWMEGGVQYTVMASSITPDAEVIKLAESIVPGAAAASFTATAPAGYSVSYDGGGNVQPAWSYNLQYSRENLDKPYDDSITIEVRPAGNEQLDAFQMLGMGAVLSKSVKVGGLLDATLITMEPGAIGDNPTSSNVSTSLMWRTGDGLVVNLSSQGLSEAELVTFAESISTVDEATFRATVGDRLQSNGGYVGPDFTVPGVVTFTGTTDGQAWTLKVTPPTETAALNVNCVRFEFDGIGVVGGSCMPGPFSNDSQLLDGSSSSGANGFNFVYGVVSNRIRKVVVRDADTNKDIVSFDTVAGTGGDDRHAYVASLEPLPKDAKNFVVVGLDEKGEVVGTPRPEPAGAYPGNLGDPSEPGSPPVAAPATIPGSPVLPAQPEASDPSKLPVFSSGTLDGRTWELRKPAGLTPDGPICWFLSFAAGGPQFACGGRVDPKLNIAVVHDRRNFVLANTSADTTKVKATFKDGRTQNVVPTVKGTDRVAVIALSLNDVLVSVTAVDANGKDTTTVTGSLPGDPSLPYDFAGDSASGGGFMTTATTVGPALVTAPPTTAKP